MPLSRLSLIYKALTQLGPGPLALNALYRLGVRTGHYRRVEARAYARLKPPAKLPGLFKLPDREALLNVMGVEGRAALLAEAEEILGGRVRLFGADPVPLRLTFEGPLQHWTHYELQSGWLEAHGVEDIKFLWEPARFGWAYTLGRAWYVTGEDRFAAAFWKYFEEFTAANPPGLGPHWMNGQEVALRLMAFVWAGQVMEAASASTPARLEALARSVAGHASRLPHTIIYARSQENNHLVTEAAGLYTAGRALDRRDWQALGWRWLNRALQRQVDNQGEYIQHSTNYQRLVLDTALWVDLIRNVPWPERTYQSLTKAVDYLFMRMDWLSGGVPNQGANDGAQVLRLSSSPFRDYRPTLKAAGRAFMGLLVKPGLWDEMSLWMGQEPDSSSFNPRVWPLGHNLYGWKSWVIVRIGESRSRHGHMDQLHLDLWWRGLNIARDAGTYLYNAPPPWDNPLVTTRVHNTVTVDGRDQMTRGGRFLLLDWVRAYYSSGNKNTPAENTKMTNIGVHYAYPGVGHQRQVTERGGDRWLVEDYLVPRDGSEHTYRLHWLLPDWEYDVREGNPLKLRLRSPYGWLTLSMRLECEGGLAEASRPRLTLIRAGEVVHGEGKAEPWEGWESPTYGVKIPALSAAMETDSCQHVKFTSEFIFPV